jgi:hypothetical protein
MQPQPPPLCAQAPVWGTDGAERTNSAPSTTDVRAASGAAPPCGAHAGPSKLKAPPFWLFCCCRCRWLLLFFLLGAISIRPHQKNGYGWPVWC